MASRTGLDLVIEGTARKVTDRVTLERLAKLNPLSAGRRCGICTC